MIETQGSVTYSVHVENERGRGYPEVLKDGITYVIAKPGDTFQVKVVRDTSNPPLNQYFGAGLRLDGETVGGFRHLVGNKVSKEHCTFKGWRIDHINTRVFVFGQPSQSTVTDEHSMGVAAESLVGSLVVTFWQMERYKCPAPKKKCTSCEFYGFGKNLEARTAKEPASVLQADGKKFFTAPSLTAASGHVVTRKAPGREAYHWRQKGKTPEFEMKLRFETAPILLLRKVLDRNIPEHAKLLEGDAFEGAGRAGSIQQVTAASQQAADTKPKVMKKEVSISSGVAKTDPVEGEAGARTQESAPAPKRTPLPTVIETVDLTEDDGEDLDCLMYTVSKKPKLEAIVSFE